MTKASLSILLCAAAMVTACGERAQTTGDGTVKYDVPSWQGAENRYVTPSWQQGDRASWDKQLRRRTQSQNEHVRISH
jgi:hypothetical protein